MHDGQQVAKFNKEYFFEAHFSSSVTSDIKNSNSNLKVCNTIINGVNNLNKTRNVICGEVRGTCTLCTRTCTSIKLGLYEYTHVHLKKII